ncbi:MAG: YicC family protein [Clostridiales bacterium]|nr:YicC family protein [Clostridiales bacterium]
MIRSMTGYGRAVQTIDGREITVELRSVNNRYLDCTVKLPRMFSFAEDSVKNRVKAAVSRGKVDIYIGVNAVQTADVQVAVNRPVIESYLAALRQIETEYGVRDDVTVMSLARLPDVFSVEKTQEDEQKLTQDILSVAEEAISRYNAMRETEGAALEADLRGRAATILERVALVEQRSPATVAEYRERLRQKMQEVLQNTAIDEGRILQEAAIYADRIAVDEETVRLRSHLAQLGDMLTKGGAIGRKLDFLLQELNRETNTVGSKCNDLELSNIVVDMKAELEKIREQTQNIE